MTNLNNALSQYCGTEQYFYHPMFPSYQYTDGIKAMAELYQAYWIIEFILIAQKNLSSYEFQVWKFECRENICVVSATDGNETEIYKRFLYVSLMPDGILKIYLQNNIMFLPSEY